MVGPQLKVRLYGDSCLREKCKVLKEVGPAERLFIQSMIEAMHKYKGIGLAAPQVGISQRILVADIGDGPIAVINPEVLEKDGLAVLEEGCLSIPDVTINVTRPVKILLRYMDENNEVQERIFEDLLARVILHETDHLDGKLIVDYATQEELDKWKSKLNDIKKKQQEED